MKASFHVLSLVAACSSVGRARSLYLRGPWFESKRADNMQKRGRPKAYRAFAILRVAFLFQCFRWVTHLLLELTCFAIHVIDRDTLRC